MVCTANVCRSPMGAGLLLRNLRAAGHDAVVTSAGTRSFGVPVDPVATQSMRNLGVDISGHVPRQFDTTILDTDGADLIVAMTREHLRALVASHRTTFGRTFTLRELLRRCGQYGRTNVGWDEWLSSVAFGRTASALMGTDEADDISDPYGLGRGRVKSTASELDLLTQQLAAAAPW